MNVNNVYSAVGQSLPKYYSSLKCSISLIPPPHGLYNTCSNFSAISIPHRLFTSLTSESLASKTIVVHNLGVSCNDVEGMLWYMFREHR